MAGRLAGKVAIVTGAGSSGPGMGNGKAAALLFAREGAAVACVDNILERAEETVAAIVAEGNRAMAIVADVTKLLECERMVASCIEAFGQLNIIHNNVGVGSRAGILEIDEDEWDRVLAVDLKSMAFVVRAAVPQLTLAGGGAIVNVSSIAATRAIGGVGSTAYAAAKAGVMGLTVSLAGQLADRRIRVNCIAPGYVYTPMVSGQMSDETRQRRRSAGLLPDEGTAFDVGWAAVYLASDEASWVTGQVLFVDGGLTVATRVV